MMASSVTCAFPCTGARQAIVHWDGRTSRRVGRRGEREKKRVREGVRCSAGSGHAFGIPRVCWCRKFSLKQTAGASRTPQPRPCSLLPRLSTLRIPRLSPAPQQTNQAPKTCRSKALIYGVSLRFLQAKMLTGTVRWLAAGVVLAAGLCDASLAAPAAKLQNVGAGGTLRLR